MATNNFHERINDHPLSFGMQRYSTGDKDNDKSLWKLIISEYCGNKTMFSVEVSLSDLNKIKLFCEKAMKTLETDGGRNDRP